MKRIIPFTIGFPTVLMLVLMVAASPVSAEVIKAIDVIGNSKTTDDTVIFISGVEIGDDFAFDEVSVVQAKLVDSGLFKNVEVSYTAFQGGLKIRILAEDKHSWVVAPTYYNQPTNKGGGIGFGENNLFGENKKLLLYAQYATGDSFFVAGYIDPSIRNTRFNWQADVYLLRERSIEYAEPTQLDDDPQQVRQSKLNYLNSGLRLGVNLFRGLSLNTRLRGAKVFYDDTELAAGADITEVTDVAGATQVPEPGIEGWDVSGELQLEYDSRANWYGISHGDRYRLTLERALPALGSDFDYASATLLLERARRHYKRHNSVVKIKAAYGVDLPFHAEFTTGGTNLRGYKNDQMRGNYQLLANMEYSVPTVEIKGVAVRLLGFVDVSYTGFTDRASNIDTRNYLPVPEDVGEGAPFKSSVGVGTRLFVRQIVLPLLGVDVGYGPERNSWEIYLAIGLTDV